MFIPIIAYGEGHSHQQVGSLGFLRYSMRCIKEVMNEPKEGNFSDVPYATTYLRISRGFSHNILGELQAVYIRSQR